MTNAPRNDPSRAAPLSALLARLNREFAAEDRTPAGTEDAAVRELMAQLSPVERRQALLAVLSDAAALSRRKLKRSLMETVVFGGAIAAGLAIGAQAGYWTAARQQGERSAAVEASGRAVLKPAPEREELHRRDRAHNSEMGLTRGVTTILGADRLSRDKTVRPSGEESIPEPERVAEPAPAVGPAADPVMPDRQPLATSAIHTASVTERAKARVAKRNGRALAAAFATATTDGLRTHGAQVGAVLSDAPLDLPAVGFAGIVDLSRFTYPLSFVSAQGAGPFDDADSPQVAAESIRPMGASHSPDALAEGMSKVRHEVHAAGAVPRSVAGSHDLSPNHVPQRDQVKRPRPRARDAAVPEKPRRSTNSRREDVREPGFSRSSGEARALRPEASPRRPIVRELSSWMPSVLAGQ